MKAVVLSGLREVTVEERPLPNLAEGEVLVRIRAAGICGSDLHGFQGRIPERRPKGLVMGHEAAGEVASIGHVSGGFKVGDRVCINPLIPCGECFACRRGWFHMCDSMITFGSAMRVFRDGAFSEYLAVPYRQLRHLPSGVGYEAAALAEPAGNAVHLLNRGTVEIGSSIAIFGTGTIGLMAVQAARLSGADKVFAVDVNQFRLGVASELGADVTINAREQDPVKAIMQETDGQGADLAVESAGFAVTYRQSVEAVRKRGKVIALGFMEPEVTMPLRSIIYRELSILGSTAFTYEIDAVLTLLASGKLASKPVITHSFPLEAAQEAFETADRPDEAIKVMIIP